jgi:MFS family permease
MPVENELGLKDDSNFSHISKPQVNGEPIEYDQVVPVCPSNTTKKKLLARIDFHVIPCLCILYILAYLDRVNIGNVRSFGLTKDLKLVGNQYNTALTIFFVSDILLEIPSNILLKRLGPRIWLSGCMFGFGLVILCQGLVKSYHGLLATRFFLGVFEAGMFPGSFYLIGMWYKRSEAQRRFSFFFSSTTFAGAFSGLLAAAIGKMDGLRGFSGWRWVFVLEGVFTVLVAIAFFFILPTFPEDAKWLTREEKDYVKARLQLEQGHPAYDCPITLRDIGRVFKDFKIFIGGFMYLGMLVPSYGFAFFAPTILATYKWSPIQTQLYSVPPWACAFVLAMIVAFCSDRTKHRFVFTLVPICIAMAGFAILITVHDNRSVEYAGLFFVVMGSFTAMPVIVCWFNLNIGGHHRRAVGSAWQIGFGNVGGIIATYSFLAADAPLYRKGFFISLAFLCLAFVSCCAYAIAITAQNRKKDKTPATIEMTEAEKAELGVSFYSQLIIKY